MAIALVLARHSFPRRFGAGGFVGVELFFVLSGFLITMVLLRDAAAGGISFSRFYRNRILRLVPALLIVVAVVATLAASRDSFGDSSSVTAGVVSALSYTTDLPMWHLGQFRALTHLWTLAIEEQFYLVWPLVLLVLIRRGERVIRIGTTVLLAASAIALVTTVLDGAVSGDVARVYVWPTTWAVTLAAGCAFAVGALRFFAGPTIGTVSVVALVALAVTMQAKDHVAGYVVVLPIAAVLALVLVSNAISPRPSALLGLRPLQYLGTISYGAYLWNYPMSWLLGPVQTIVATIIIASISYWGVERYFLRLKSRPRTGDSGRKPARMALMSETPEQHSISRA